MKQRIIQNFPRAVALFVLCVLFTTVFLGSQMTVPVAYAANNRVLNFDKTDIMEDLGSSTIDGKPFNLENYPKNPYGSVEVLSFIEYCYSFYENGNGNYALYVYLYNPALVDIDVTNTANKIQIATDFFYEGESGKLGEPQSYSKFSLKFCSVSTGEYDKRFYKFRVVDENNVILNAIRTYEKTFGGKRLYALSGVEWVDKNTSEIDDIKFGKRYVYSGYAEGYGNSDGFPLTCNVDFLETVELDVHNTFYRPNDNEDIVGQNGMTQDQLNSVYFAVPNRLLEEYGGLQKIRAEWWEYKTNPIVITESEELYNALNAFIGVDVGSYNSDVGFSLTTKREIVASSGDLTSYRSDWGYNIDDGLLLNCSNEVSALYYLFDTFDETENKYIPLDDFKLKGEELEKYVESYDKSFTNGTLNVDGKKISADLFTGDIDEKRQADGYKVGYNDVTIDKDEVYNILSREDTTPWWQIWGSQYEETEFANVKAIEEVTADSMKLDKKEFCDTYLVDYDDYADLKAMYDEAVTLNPLDPDDELKTVFLFRFAQTDYFSRALEVGYWKSVVFPPTGSGWVFGYDKYPTGYAQTTAFLSFDVIELTFLKDGVYTVIPAVSDPIDIFSDVTVPEADKPQFPDWVKYLFMALSLIVLLVILMPILPYIVQAIIWVVMLPFKLIAAIFKGIGDIAKKKPKKTDVSPPKAVQAKPPKNSKRK